MRCNDLYMRKNKHQILESMVLEFSSVNSKRQILDNYKWFSHASGIKENKEVHNILREILSDERGNI